MRTLLLTLAAVALLDAQPVAVAVSRADSYIAVRVDKGGLFSAFAGHQHGVLATDWSADVCFDPAQPEATKVHLTVVTPALRIDTPEARRRAGLEADNGPGPDDVAEIQNKMLAPENLAAAEHPAIRFESRSTRLLRDDQIEVEGDLTIRERTTKATFPTQVHVQPDGRVDFSGQVELKQTDFGIKPVSIGGVVNVKDQVTALFRVGGRLTNRPCKLP